MKACLTLLFSVFVTIIVVIAAQDFEYDAEMVTNEAEGSALTAEIRQFLDDQQVPHDVKVCFAFKGQYQVIIILMTAVP